MVCVRAAVFALPDDIDLVHLNSFFGRIRLDDPTAEFSIPRAD